MNKDDRKLRFGLWYDFRNPSQWRQPYDRLHGETFDQIAWGENHGFDDVWLSEHHFIEDRYLPSVLPVAAAIAARNKCIRIAFGVLLMLFHNPVRLAEDIGVVDVISGGRFEVASASVSSWKRVEKMPLVERLGDPYDWKSWVSNRNRKLWAK
jgi:alkanesulfonate monooxygenase SsuD/methylene tetrahydromethanopterin reductase-like flavin-dependent oxidoreductase (luciferase family)